MDFSMIKYLRECDEKNQEEKAEECGVARSTYAGWENGLDIIPLKKLIFLCNKYKVSVDYILKLIKINNFSGEIIIDNNIISNNLYFYRMKILGISQEDFCLPLKVNQSTYSSYETAKKTVNLSFLYSLWLTYNISIDWVLSKHD